MYANIIIDISHEKVDKLFQYKIPPALFHQVETGVQVWIPFGAGNQKRRGYVVELTKKAEYDPQRIKEIIGIVEGSVTAETQLIQLAWWMKERYGSTMNQALKTVLPVKQKVRQKEKRDLVCLLTKQDLQSALEEANKKGYQARARLLKAFSDNPVVPYTVAVNQMNLTMATIKPMVEKQMVSLESETLYRNPSISQKHEGKLVVLNDQQEMIVQDFISRYDRQIRETSLIYGITGSGKTEV